MVPLAGMSPGLDVAPIGLRRVGAVVVEGAVATDPELNGRAEGEPASRPPAHDVARATPTIIANAPGRLTRRASRS